MLVIGRENTFGIPDAVGGAWLGGTLDTSASVVAAGEMISDSARDAGVVVKLSQNVLIGASVHSRWSGSRIMTVCLDGRARRLRGFLVAS